MPIQLITVDHPLYPSVLQLRDDILRKPLGRSIKNDDLSDEVNQFIFVDVENDQLRGCVLAKRTGQTTLQLRQMAVNALFQGKQLGKGLVTALEEYGVENGIEVVELHARKYAEGFYLKCGYITEGDEFQEVGIPHVIMKKVLYKI